MALNWFERMFSIFNSLSTSHVWADRIFYSTANNQFIQLPKCSQFCVATLSKHCYWHKYVFCCGRCGLLLCHLIFFDAIFVIILIISHLAFAVIKFNQSTHSTDSMRKYKSLFKHYTRKTFVSIADTHRTTYKFHIKSTRNGKSSNFLLCHELRLLKITTYHSSQVWHRK